MLELPVRKAREEDAELAAFGPPTAGPGLTCEMVRQGSGRRKNRIDLASGRRRAERTTSSTVSSISTTASRSTSLGPTSIRSLREIQCPRRLSRRGGGVEVEGTGMSPSRSRAR